MADKIAGDGKYNRLIIDDLITDDRTITMEELQRAVQIMDEAENSEKSMAVYAEAVYETGLRIWAQRCARFTRQRRRQEVRQLLWGFNLFPKNLQPRSARRKAMLAGVNQFMKLNPIAYEEGR